VSTVHCTAMQIVHTEVCILWI